MIREAEAHAEEDKRRRGAIEARNQADATVYMAERALKDAEGRVPSDLKNTVAQAIAGVRETMNSENVQQIKNPANGYRAQRPVLPR